MNRDCFDAPDNCLGQEVYTKCVVWTGPDVAGHSCGARLEDVISAISAEKTPQTTPSIGTSDDITVSGNYKVGSSECSLRIVNRNFEWSLLVNPSESIFTYDFAKVISDLPADISLGALQVKATGKDKNGSNLVGQASAISGGFAIDQTRYPVTVDVTIRLISTCGNIELVDTILLSSASIGGSYIGAFTVNDLNPSQNSNASLTTALKELQKEVNACRLGLDIYTKENSALGNVDIKTFALSLQAKLNTFEEKLGQFGNQLVTYESNGLKFNTISNIFSDIYSRLDALTSEDQSLDSRIDTLEATI